MAIKLTNKEKNKRRFIFTLLHNPEVYTFLNNKRDKKELSEWINKAVVFYHDYEFYKKGFLIRMIEHNYAQCKYLLRKIGRALSG